MQSGCWSEINTNSNNKDLIFQSFITISQAHSQASDSYAYTLLPNISKADFDKVCSEARIEVLRNDSKLQLIHDKKQDLLAVVKYNQAKEVVNGQLSLENQAYTSIKRWEMTLSSYLLRPYHSHSSTLVIS